ncbi:MAG TPA: hypothetical protein DCP20_01280 [Coriobacteriia bacterium]|nr:hypothetical protein [Coriobacteriia bacterium]
MGALLMRKHVSDTGRGIMGDIAIRVATAGDRDSVFSLLRSAAVWLRERGVDYWQNWHDPPELHVRWIDDGLAAGEFRIVESSRSVIGCFRLQDSDEMFWGPRSDEAGYIHSLTIDRTLAGLGFGQTVIGAIERDLVARGANALRLDCGVGAVGLRDYYESCGFRSVGETVVDGEHLVLYQKSLDSLA